MTDRIFRENITHLTGQLAFEPSASKRRQLARRIKQEIEHPEAVDYGTVTMLQGQNGDYWKSRAERTRQQAQRYRSEAVRDHLLKIARGYEELAKRAYAAQ